MNWLKALNRNRLLRKRSRLIDRIAHHRQEQTRYALMAYDMDQMARPLKWGNLQNEANWHGEFVRRWKEELKKVDQLLQEQEQK